MKNGGIMTLSCDELLLVEIKFPFLCIVNSDERYLPGMHWIAIFGDENKHCYFWDSLGLSPEHYKEYFMQFINKYCVGYCYVNSCLRSQSSRTCGLYCLYFL